MAQPRWCLDLGIQNVAEDVALAPLPKTLGPSGVLRAGSVLPSIAQAHLLYYARNQASDLTGFYRLDPDNIDDPVTLTSCVDVPAQGGQWVETDPIDFITDENEVTGVKSDDALTMRVRAKWHKADTSLDPQFKQLRVEVARRRDNSPSPPDFEVFDSHTFGISQTLSTYSTGLNISTWWGGNHRYLLRCTGRFYRKIQI